MTLTLLGKIMREYNRLTRDGKSPDALFLNKESLNKLVNQVAIAYNVQDNTVREEFLGMKIYTSAQYRDEAFRIYCKPIFEKE